MPSIHVHLECDPPVAELLQGGRLRQTLDGIGTLAGAKMVLGDDARPARLALEDTAEVPLRYRGRAAGHLLYQRDGESPDAALAVNTVQSLLEHTLEREAAIDDLARTMVLSFEELNMLYTLLPQIAQQADAGAIGQLLVDETARMLNCRRVSLLVLDDQGECLRVLAAKGLPEHVRNVSIPVADSIAGQALLNDDLIVVNNTEDRAELSAASRGTYQTSAFSIVRVPLRACGDALGVLTVTERIDGSEFTSRDRKLLGGLSAVGASALMNCRLHAALSRQMLDTIEALALAVDAKDHYTHDHSRRVSELCVASAKLMGMQDPSVCREVRLAALLHDIGKIGIADQILSKRTQLSPEEFAIIQTHAEIGAQIVGRVKGLDSVVRAIRHHHERYDGLGYPDGLSGDNIPIMARLITVSDVYDCLTSDRPYRKASSGEKAVAELVRCQGTQFDPAVVEAMVEVIAATNGGP